MELGAIGVGSFTASQGSYGNVKVAFVRFGEAYVGTDARHVPFQPIRQETLMLIPCGAE
jgi:hypothetical protein